MSNHPSRSRKAATPEPLKWQRLSEIEMKSIVFLDSPLWQASAFHLVAGRKGSGKGTVLADLGARFTRGELGEKRNVIWITSEDSASIDIKPRLVAADGNDDRVVVLTDWLQLPRDVRRLGATIEEVGDVGLVIIDPVGNHITGKSSNSDTDIRDALAPLNSVADEYELVLVGIRHLSQKEARAGALAAILGASAWVQIPRAVIGIAKDNEDASVSHIQCLSGNRLPPETPGMSFQIEGVELEGLENEVTHCVWLGDSTKSVETLIGEAPATSQSDTARKLILELLDQAPDGRMETDKLDAHVVRETGLAPQTVRNVRNGLRKVGLLQPVPERDDGVIVCWWTKRTNVENFKPTITRRVRGEKPDTRRKTKRR